MSKSTKFLTGLLSLIVASTALSSIARAEEGDARSSVEKALSETVPLLDARLRYETVKQNGFANDADAVTYRLRAGLQTGSVLDTRFLIEFDFIDDLADDFNSTINGRAAYPVVPDPNATELNRIQLVNKSLPDTIITLGRQRIIVDDSRFIGNVGWRQNEQTFDGVRLENTSLGELKFDATWLNQINRVFGDDSPAGTWEGDTFLVNMSHPIPIGTLTGFAYMIDVDNAGGAFSSETFGARLSGSRDIGEGRLGYMLSYATQSDYGSSHLDYSADYFLLESSFTQNKVMAGLGIEHLGGDTQRGFQTPLATLHKFQGWADKFLITPSTGLEDIYAKLGYTVGDAGILKGVKLLGIYHDFSADVGGADYGSEIDLQVTAKWKNLGLTLKYADYNADDFATDTTKFWFQLDFAL